MRLRLTCPMLAALAASPAGAQTPSAPICSQPAVLEHLDAMLHEAGRPLVLDTARIGEYSPPTSRLVHCAVRAWRPGVDTSHQGTQPLDATTVIRYALELRPHAIFLSLE